MHPGIQWALILTVAGSVYSGGTQMAELKAADISNERSSKVRHDKAMAEIKYERDTRITAGSTISDKVAKVENQLILIKSDMKAQSDKTQKLLTDLLIQVSTTHK